MNAIVELKKTSWKHHEGLVDKNLICNEHYVDVLLGRAQLSQNIRLNKSHFNASTFKLFYVFSLYLATREARGVLG